MTILEDLVKPGSKRIDWRDLLRAVLRENPKDSEAVHKQNFRVYIQQEDYREYLEDLIDRMLQLEYNNVVRSVFPPTKEKLKETAKVVREDRRTRERDVSDAIKKQEEKIVAKLLDFITPNGKKLRNCTGSQCATFGGWFIKVSKAVKPDQRVGDVLDEEKLKELLAKK